MSDISIVTFFFDTGRGDWTPEKGFPSYLHRTNSTYLERFSYLAKLKNQMIIFTSPDMVDKIAYYRKESPADTIIIPFNYKESFNEERARIHEIQKNPEFQNKIAPHQRINPEYWNPDYVLLMALKSWFVKTAIEGGIVKNDLVAYIDFGYCRSADKVPKSEKWEYNFDPNKIHLFGYKNYPEGRPIEEVIYTNDVYILGAKAITSQRLWPYLFNLVTNSLEELFSKELVDDDQTLWLMSHLKDPELFEIHKIPDHQYGHDSFVLFNNYNDTVKQ